MARSPMVTETLTCLAMRRALVLTSESARHPFRASLPPHVFARMGEVEQCVPWYLRLGLTRADIQNAAATYCTGFVAAFTFFA
ncbi:MAG: hypothetical protein B7Y88_11965 [Sphingomonadales bacterium 32-64-17]|nr:MAG: hypothetical protein B7Y88_11965 [Sphingomonadales bacterium 32-64-17]